jgi:hypothetical protein
MLQRRTLTITLLAAALATISLGMADELRIGPDPYLDLIGER